MVASLSPEDMKNLGAYYGSQAPKPGKAKEPALVAVGQKLYRGGNQASGVPACSSCHSPNGAGIPTQFPRLAGQHADYTLTQLRAFRTGGRDNDAAKMMRVIASKMTEQEMQAVSDYIAGLH
jgi:cytochrome c553